MFPYISRDDRIKSDFECPVCSYNLRTLSSESACPECGEPISKSLMSRLPGQRRERNQIAAVILASVILLGVVYGLTELYAYCHQAGCGRVMDVLAWVRLLGGGASVTVAVVATVMALTGKRVKFFLAALVTWIIAWFSILHAFLVM